ncbi:hypothetical protein [Streptomyces sp. NPDC048106]|uniref:hypothetical protein n=1 Tax=Streptomyces sp. NPDC048106 TaxID=3155750 RepID=UPI0034548ABD
MRPGQAWPAAVKSLLVAVDSAGVVDRVATSAVPARGPAAGGRSVAVGGSATPVGARAAPVVPVVPVLLGGPWYGTRRRAPLPGEGVRIPVREGAPTGAQPCWATNSLIVAVM